MQILDYITLHVEIVGSINVDSYSHSKR